MTAAQDAMNTLSQQWYNAIVSQCGFDPNTFQLVQGFGPIGTTSERIWQLFDPIPPVTVTQYFDPSALVSFSQTYSGVISALIPQGGEQFEADMGQSYAAWLAYKPTLQPLPTTPEAWRQAFTNWAEANVPTAQLTKVIGDYKTMLLDPIAVAADMLTAVQFATQNADVCAYDVTIDDVQQELANGVPKSISFDSRTESSDVSQTWAKTEVGGLFDIFAGEGNADYESVTMQMASAGITIQASFEKLVTIQATGLEQPSSDYILANYTPWYNSAALAEGYESDSNNVWKAGDAITWATTFGPNGTLLRTTSAIVIVDGISITMTSNAAFSAAQQETFKAAFAAGIWPFFEAEGSGGWSSSYAFDDAGNVTVTSTAPTGNPQVLGVIVTPITSQFAAAVSQARLATA